MAYRRSADIDNLLDGLAGFFPDVVEKIELGPSRQKRPVNAVRIRSGTATNRRGVLLVGGIHARELLNPDLLVDLAMGLVLNYVNGTDWVMGGQTWSAATLQLIVETLDTFILPNANPDGREFVFDTYPMWRKNLRDHPNVQCSIADGVDVNRNFDLLWGIETRDPQGNIRTSRSACSDVFVGPGAFSEPETRNVRTLLDAHRIEVMVDVHSFAETILFPWGHAPSQVTDPGQRFTLVDTSDWEELPRDAPNHEEFIPALDLQRFEDVGQRAAEAIFNVRARNYTVKPGLGLYPTTGTCSDYAYGRHVVDGSKPKVYGFTFETGPEVASVQESFQPLDPEAGHIAEEAMSGLVSVLASSICAIDLVGSDLLGAENDSLQAMRRVRDEDLAQREPGRAWIRLLERNQLELAQQAVGNPDLRAAGGELIVEAGRLLTEGGQVTPDVVAQVTGLVEHLLRRGEISEQLREDLAQVGTLASSCSGADAIDVIGRLKETPPAGSKRPFSSS